MKDPIPEHKWCSHLYDSDSKGEDKEEEVVAAMCHNGESYSSIKVNRKDYEYLKQLNQ